MKDFSQYKLNVKKSPFDPRTYKAAKFLRAYALPEELDMRDVFDKYFPVFDQGSQGSCAACAGTAMRQWQEYVDTTLTKKLSEQFIYNNREDLQEEGMYMKNLMSILFKVGICLNDLCQYGNLSKPTPEAYKDAVKRLVKGYAQVDTVDEFKQALYSQGPCVIAVPVYNYTERMWYQRAGDQFLGGHAMCCVGYNKEGFIIRNSWSEEWGQKGYAILPYNDFPWIWEVWTTIDADTNTGAPTTTLEPKKKLSWWKILLLILGAIGIITVGVLLLLR